MSMTIDPAVPSLVRSFWHGRKARMSPLETRAIGPICTALEAYNFKRAHVLCDARLKSQSADPAALALKALALYMSSRPASDAVRQDILKIVETVKTANKGAAMGDADVLLVFLHVLRGMGSGDGALALLSQATHQFPDNEDLTTEAFLSYIRLGETKSAQQMGMKLATRFKDERYLWWSLLSTILQIRDLSRPHPQGALLLALAERQLAARFSPSADSSSSSSPPDYASADEFQVVTRFLELRVQYAALPSSMTTAAPSSAPLVLPSLSHSDTAPTPAQALLAHFASPVAEKWCESNLGFELWKREAMLQYGTAGGKEWEVLWERLQGALEKEDTNWHTMLYLIRAAFSLAAGSSAAYYPSSSSPSPPPSANQPSTEALEFATRSRALFRRMATDSPKAKVERGFVLASLEIARESRSRGWEEAEPLLLLMEEYFDRFATKMCCFDDIYPYLEVLSPTEVSSLRNKLHQEAQSANLSTASEVTRSINAYKVVRFLGEASTEETEKMAAEEFLRKYLAALPAGNDLPSTELQPADDFALLACEAFVSAYHLSHDRSYLERALVTSESALLRSKYKYQLRIISLNLLRLLGAPSASLTHYRPLGVKNIQYDTLSHLVVGRAATFAIEGNTGKEGGVFEAAAETERWYKNGMKEAQEMVVKALNYNTYSKVEDFSEFRHRLENSEQKSLVSIETLRMRLVRGVLDSSGIEEAIKVVEALVSREEGFCDNRDYKTLPNYQQKGSPTIWQQTELGERQDSHWLRAFATGYARVLKPSAFLPSSEAPSSLTRAEASLLAFLDKLQAVLVADLAGAGEVEQAGLAWFKAHSELFVSALDDPKSLPWEVLQIAEIALEAFSLLELGIDQRLAEMVIGKLPDQPRHAKRLRAFRANARDLVRSVGAKLTAYSKKVAKERPKVLAAVADLRQFEMFDEDRLTNVAHTLVESRKSAAEALGAAIHRRCVK
ncbi:hypothetical protein JCM11251_001269 [Rhodosporidiobolus azoricus]